jgi:DNA modification methylase
MKINEIYLGDCLELMPKHVEDKSIDMIFCDLPYGTTQNKWDSVIPLDKLWGEYERVIKDNGAIVLFSQTPFDKVLGASNLKLLKYELIWEKNRPTGHLNAKRIPMKAHENLLVFYKKLPKYNPQMTEGHKPLTPTHGKQNKQTNYGLFDVKVSERQKKGGQTNRYPRSVLKFNVLPNGNLNPTQKPLDLIEYIIRTYTNDGDLILDNTCGSGTTGLGAKNLNRNYIMMEQDPKYYEIACKRVQG